MKNLILIATLALTANSAFASSVTCSTNVNHDPRVASTSIEISMAGSQAEATMVTSGGMAMFVTAPRSIPVQVTNYGPEVVEYTNTQADFLLEVSFQPIGGEIHGTYTFENEGQRVQQPVVCITKQ